LSWSDARGCAAAALRPRKRGYWREYWSWWGYRDAAHRWFRVVHRGQRISRISLARRKPGVQIPSPPPQPRRSERRQRQAGRRSPHAGAALGPRTPLEGCSTSAWERLPKLVDRQSNPSLNSVCREQAGAPVVQDLPGGRCPLVIVVLDVQASQHSNRPCCSSYLARYCLYGNGPRAGTASASRTTATSRFLTQVARHRLLQPLCAHRGGVVALGY
jgi:hypothetical protein